MVSCSGLLFTFSLLLIATSANQALKWYLKVLREETRPDGSKYLRLGQIEPQIHFTFFNDYTMDAVKGCLEGYLKQEHHLDVEHVVLHLVRNGRVEKLDGRDTFISKNINYDVNLKLDSCIRVKGKIVLLSNNANRPKQRAWEGSMKPGDFEPINIINRRARAIKRYNDYVYYYNYYYYYHNCEYYRNYYRNYYKNYYNR
ncbi:hypothetical protein BX661DRAFT_37171 [Kickxella alabastrina]|uniref:uncharacterized protein n=1 Tax=Kickxella alabastrina TaxID=61397 RepID=UPI00221FE658|nr:uncharacterized protein BX661DRAFT_37171 [Kickxella alabastrina]KAI7825951.1 hypothetical protein BX661DRAFT_37171 [Kickxella alabastrina]